LFAKPMIRAANSPTRSRKAIEVSESNALKKSPTLEFESSLFTVVFGEDDETNPGIYGRSLAQWLSNQLRVVGVVAGDVKAEDFGWLVPVKSEPYSLFVACSSGEKSNQWMVFAYIEGGLVPRLFRKDKSADLLESLYATVRRCLEKEPSINRLCEDT
jgi:hypothetical protein